MIARETMTAEEQERWAKNLPCLFVCVRQMGCDWDGCEKPHYAHGWCEQHYAKTYYLVVRKNR